jgi:hypothetical protein
LWTSIATFRLVISSRVALVSAVRNTACTHCTCRAEPTGTQATPVLRLDGTGQPLTDMAETKPEVRIGADGLSSTRSSPEG